MYDSEGVDNLYVLQDRLMQPVEESSSENQQDADKGGDKQPEVAEWRYGPAQLWYDMLNTDDTGEDFDYGYKNRQASIRLCTEITHLAKCLGI